MSSYLKSDLGDDIEADIAHQTAFGIRQKLSHDDPTNTTLLRAVSIRYLKKGEIQESKTHTSEALTSYNQAADIDARLLKIDPYNTVWLRDFS